jgi:endonuclease/exonuclease/phosphatase (EEP) superfamily protein YafD
MAVVNTSRRKLLSGHFAHGLPSNNHGACPRSDVAGTEPLDSSAIHVFNWNIQKGKRKGWQYDLASMAHDKDLILIQEAAMHAELVAVSQKANYWSFAPGYTNKRLQTGVMTMSSRQPMMHCSLVTWEPWLGTPKATNVTEFALTGTEDTLMVVNIHAVNFTLGLEAFRQQIQQVHALLDIHQGPVIFSGDFNTWRRERLQMLELMLGSLGMGSLAFDTDRRKKVFGQHLDHIYTRDLHVIRADTQKVRSSDHNPMSVTFSI